MTRATLLIHAHRGHVCQRRISLAFLGCCQEIRLSDNVFGKSEIFERKLFQSPARPRRQAVEVIVDDPAMTVECLGAWVDEISRVLQMDDFCAIKKPNEKRERRCATCLKLEFRLIDGLPV